MLPYRACLGGGRQVFPGSGRPASPREPPEDGVAEGSTNWGDDCKGEVTPDKAVVGAAAGGDELSFDLQEGRPMACSLVLTTPDGKTHKWTQPAEPVKGVLHLDRITIRGGYRGPSTTVWLDNLKVMP